jgi:hypothetical protein
MDFKELSASILLFSLLILGIFFVVIDTQDFNNAENNINENTLINRTFNDLRTNLSSAQSESQISSSSISNKNI